MKKIFLPTAFGSLNVYRLRVLLAVLLAIPLCWVGAAAQVVTNGGYEGLVRGCSNNNQVGFEDFAYGCVNGWYPSHGDVGRYLLYPNYVTNGARLPSGTDPRGNLPFMGSGIYTNVSLVPGAGYKLSFQARRDWTQQVGQTVNIALVTGLTPGTTFVYPSVPSPFPYRDAQPTPAQQMNLTQQALTDVLSTYTVSFTAPSWQNTQLWIYVPATATYYYDYKVAIDNVSITKDLTVALSDPVVRPLLDDAYGISTQATATGGTGSYTYAWQIDYNDGFGFRSVSNTSSTLYTTVSNPQQRITFKVIVSDGTTQAQAVILYSNGGSESRQAATAYPNPATESVTLPNGAEGAVLLNDKGKTLLKADATGKLDVQSLPDGVYNLQMIQKGKRINQRIQVKH